MSNLALPMIAILGIGACTEASASRVNDAGRFGDAHGRMGSTSPRDAGAGDCATGSAACQRVEAPIRAESVVANGITIHYRERPSEGRLVVFLHGFPDVAESWDGISADFSRAGYRTVAPSLRGYAPTEIPARDTTTLDLATDLLHLIEELGEDEAIVVAHDRGAGAAYLAANLLAANGVTGPVSVRALITIAVPHPAARALHPDWLASSPQFEIFAEPDAAERLRANDYAALDELLARWSPNWTFPREELDRMRGTFDEPGCLDAVLGFYRTTFAALSQPLPELALRPALMPGLAFYGVHDGAATNAPFADQQRGFTGPVRVIETDAGHFIHRERQALFVEEALAFLRSL